MARKKSLWSELQRERVTRQRVAQARERMNEQTIKQIERSDVLVVWFQFPWMTPRLGGGGRGSEYPRSR